MTAIDVIIENFSEIRRRSIKVWEGIPEEKLQWRPDSEAMTCIEMIRHVLEGEHLYQIIIQNRGNLGDYVSPFKARPIENLQRELRFSKPYRNEFLQMVESFSETDLEEINIDRTEAGYTRKLGDFLLRVGYHEAVHTGQMLDYLRTMNVDRPKIWD
ncbi:DinB family protein [Fulvivirgaceae bacterium BMA10]|uniref:DinB family protein n=1 Tax=Splendidivirga corallicola TaxID=3051826 RepID=A0ABT8KS37_9BACT|nr:DinB family protein [Fulvivirgaceae bacterium BMA10]